jgi:hypothetical protein
MLEWNGGMLVWWKGKMMEDWNGGVFEWNAGLEYRGML